MSRLKKTYKWRRSDGLCFSKGYPIWKNVDTGLSHWEEMVGVRPEGFKRPKLKCSRCGRKVRAGVMSCDGELIFYIPPHKPKGWWKKKMRKL